MADLADAERRYQHARARWHDAHRHDAGPAGERASNVGEQPHVRIDLTPGEQPVDLDGSRQHATGPGRPSEGGPGR